MCGNDGGAQFLVIVKKDPRPCLQRKNNQLNFIICGQNTVQEVHACSLAGHYKCFLGLLQRRSTISRQGNNSLALV